MRSKCCTCATQTPARLSPCLWVFMRGRLLKRQSQYWLLTRSPDLPSFIITHSPCNSQGAAVLERYRCRVETVCMGHSLNSGASDKTQSGVVPTFKGTLSGADSGDLLCFINIKCALNRNLKTSFVLHTAHDTACNVVPQREKKYGWINEGGKK